jgi:TolB protein
VDGLPGASETDLQSTFLLLATNEWLEKRLALGRLDGTIVRYYTSGGHVLGASWSPDATKIVYGYVPGDSGEDEKGIYVINWDGSGKRQLISGQCWDPAWSPDGTKITFVMDQDGWQDIYVMNADGSGVAKLTDDIEPDHNPRWSPDSRRIVFSSLRSRNYDIYIIDNDGKNFVQLTNTQDYDEVSPMWSPNGDLIVFTSRKPWRKIEDIEQDIYFVRPDGTGLEQITTGLWARGSVWSPDGSKIVFVEVLFPSPDEVRVMDVKSRRVSTIPYEPINVVRGMVYEVLDWRPAPTGVVQP